MFTETLMGLPYLSPELREDAEIHYRDTLVMAIGSELRSSLLALLTTRLPPGIRTKSYLWARWTRNGLL